MRSAFDCATLCASYSWKRGQAGGIYEAGKTYERGWWVAGEEEAGE